MKLKPISIFILLFLSTFLFTQSSILKKHNTFFIYGNLNTSDKTLDGIVELVYYNNTNKVLSEIHFNLWANAFNNKTKTFIKNLIQDGKTDLYFAKKEDFGWYKNLVFMYNNDTLKYKYLNIEKENCKVFLSKPLISGDSIKIKIKYKLKIPKLFYDSGYSKEQYNMVYWYPTPAVYGKKGWINQNRTIYNHLLSNKADYTVTLKVPDNFNIAASGNLITEKKLVKSNQMANIQDSNSITKLDKMQNLNFKILKYRANSIGCFSWIADPYLNVSTEKVKSNNKNLNLNLFYKKILNPKSKKFIFDETKKAVKNITSKLGTYPYDNINILISSENKTSTSFPENLIYHLDGFFNTTKYLDFIYSSITWNYLSQIHYNNTCQSGIMSSLHTLVSVDIIDSLQNIENDRHLNNLPTIQDKVIKLSSFQNNHDLNCSNCFYSYSKNLVCTMNLIALNYLKEFIGKEIFYLTLKEFISDYNDNEFDFSDFKNYVKTKTNKNIDWFFKDLVKSKTQLDYKINEIYIKKDKIEILLENKSDLKLPFEIGAIKNNTIIEILKSEGFIGRKKIILHSINPDFIQLDPRNLYLKNTANKTKWILNKPKYLLSGFSIFKKNKPTNLIFPVLGYNANDGFMPGICITDYNKIKNHYYLNFLYGLKSKSIVGSGSIQKMGLINNKIYSLGMDIRSFSRLRTENFNLRYTRLSPSFLFKLKDNSKVEKNWKFRFSLIKDEEYGQEGKDSYWRYNSQLNYVIRSKNTISPYKINFGLEHQYYNYYFPAKYLKFSSIINAAYMYQNNRFITLRLYAAKFLYNSNKNSTSNSKGTLGLVGYGTNDFLYDHYFIDRSAQSGFWSHQISMNTGGFKTAVSNSYGLGQSNNYVAALNLVIDLPIKTGIKPFLDLGFYGYLPTISDGYNNKFLYSGGIMLQLIKGNFEIYLPIVNSKEIENIYEENNNFFNRLSFMINLNINSQIKFN